MLPCGHTVRLLACPEAHLFVLHNVLSKNLAHIQDWAQMRTRQMARMDDDAQQPVGRCRTSVHPQEDHQFNVMDLTVEQSGLASPRI